MGDVGQVEREVEHLRVVITRLGSVQPEGKGRKWFEGEDGDGTEVSHGSISVAGFAVGVTFGELFDDEEGQQYFEAIVGTLRAAKKRSVVDFKGQMLLKGAHDDVVITLLKPLEA